MYTTNIQTMQDFYSKQPFILHNTTNKRSVSQLEQKINTHSHTLSKGLMFVSKRVSTERWIKKIWWLHNFNVFMSTFFLCNHTYMTFHYVTLKRKKFLRTKAYGINEWIKGIYIYSIGTRNKKEKTYYGPVALLHTVLEVLKWREFPQTRANGLLRRCSQLKKKDWSHCLPTLHRDMFMFTLCPCCTASYCIRSSEVK